MSRGTIGRRCTKREGRKMMPHIRIFVVEMRTSSQILSHHSLTIVPNRRSILLWAYQVHIFLSQTSLFCENLPCCSDGQRGCDMSKLAPLGRGEETTPTEFTLHLRLVSSALRPSHRMFSLSSALPVSRRQPWWRVGNGLVMTHNPLVVPNPLFLAHRYM